MIVFPAWVSDPTPCATQTSSRFVPRTRHGGAHIIEVWGRLDGRLVATGDARGTFLERHPW